MNRFIKDNFTLTKEGCDAALKAINELYTKYKFMEAKLLQQKKSMQSKIPDIKSALDSLNFIESKADDVIETSLELSQAVYVDATVTKPETVLLWLGANVMVEYTRAEAREMLTNNYNTANSSLADIQDHLTFLKDQITISEVNVARIHNFKVELGGAK